MQLTEEEEAQIKKRLGWAEEVLEKMIGIIQQKMIESPKPRHEIILAVGSSLHKTIEDHCDDEDHRTALLSIMVAAALMKLIDNEEPDA